MFKVWEEPCRRSKKQRALTKDAGCFDPYRCRLLCDHSDHRRNSTVVQTTPEPSMKSTKWIWHDPVWQRCNCIMRWSNSEAKMANNFQIISGLHLRTSFAIASVSTSTCDGWHNPKVWRTFRFDLGTSFSGFLIMFESIGLDWSKVHAIQMLLGQWGLAVPLHAPRCRSSPRTHPLSVRSGQDGRSECPASSWQHLAASARVKSLWCRFKNGSSQRHWVQHQQRATWFDIKIACRRDQVLFRVSCWSLHRAKILSWKQGEKISMRVWKEWKCLPQRRQ